MPPNATFNGVIASVNNPVITLPSASNPLVFLPTESVTSINISISLLAIVAIVLNTAATESATFWFLDSVSLKKLNAPAITDITPNDLIVLPKDENAPCPSLADLTLSFVLLFRLSTFLEPASVLIVISRFNFSSAISILFQLLLINLFWSYCIP